ncbi:MAG: hypothetical protein ACO1N2_01080 [Candidatus Saccharimonadota bacterium]
MDGVPERLSQKPDTVRMVVNNERVEEVLGTLMDAYREQHYPYHLDKVRVPQDERHMPQSLERGTKEHAMFLWNVCYYMRGGTKSTFAVQMMSELYEGRPDLFDCEQVALRSEPYDIEFALKSHKLGFQETVAKQWIENSWRMILQYDGDPRNIFKDLGTDAPYETLVSRVKNDNKGGGFMGFREKMTSMIAYYMMDQDLVETFNFPIPIDLHVMRVSVANGLVTFPDIEYPANVHSEALLETLRGVYFDYAERHGVDALELCNAVWLLSESLCGQAPGNRVFEPNGRDNREGRLTTIIPEVVNIEDPAQVRRYDNSCRRCPVEETCDLNVHGGAMYYAAGRLAVRGARLRFPDTTLFPESFFQQTT